MGVGNSISPFGIDQFPGAWVHKVNVGGNLLLQKESLSQNPIRTRVFTKRAGSYAEGPRGDASPKKSPGYPLCSGISDPGDLGANGTKRSTGKKPELGLFIQRKTLGKNSKTCPYLKGRVYHFHGAEVGRGRMIPHVPIYSTHSLHYTA